MSSLWSLNIHQQKNHQNCYLILPYNTLYKILKGNCSIPVMVWIHGGSFSFGSGNIDYSGFHYLVGENVVVVTINFRLNILGFLNLRNEKVPGNAGFKDQVQALKWVKENIAYFGGDPNKITLAGESSGGALVQYHILSPMSKGLFHQAISESGSCLAPYAFKERTDNIAFSVGEKLGYSTKDKDELLKHLMNSSPEQLVTTTNEFYNMGKGAMIEVPFTPTADRDSPAGDICIPDNPANLVKSGQYKSVPYITGFNSAEGILLVNGIKNTAVKNIEGTLESFSCEDFGIEEDNCNRKEIARKINEHYFTNSSDLKMKAESFINFTTDIYFFNQAYCSIRKMTPHFNAPIYMYEFSFTGNNLMYKKLFNGEEFPGAAHVEELAYMQYNTYKYQPNSRELLTSKRLNRLWGNFIKTGNPTPVPEPLLEEVIWPPVGKRDLVYLNIDNDLSVQRNPKKKSLEFWSQIHKNYSNNTVC